MRFRKDTGIWEIFAPDVYAGCAYKFGFSAQTASLCR